MKSTSKTELDETRIADALMDDATRNVPVSVDLLPSVRRRLAQPRQHNATWRRLAPLGALACTVVLIGGALAASPRLRFVAQQAAQAFWSAPATPAMEAAATSSSSAEPMDNGNLISYTVQSGDTFYSLSKKFNAYPDTLAALNGMDAADTLRAGQIITVRNNPPPIVPTLTPAPILRPAMSPITEKPTEPYELLRVRMNKGLANAVAWSPDGSAFAVASPFEVSVYDAATLRQISSVPTTGTVLALTIHTATMPGSTEPMLRLTGRMVSRFIGGDANQPSLSWQAWLSQRELIQETLANDVMALSDDGEWMVRFKDQMLEVRNRVNGSVALQANAPECAPESHHFHISPNKRYVACLTAFGAALWNLQTQARSDLYWTGKAQTEDKPLSGGDLAFSGDSRRLAASGGEYASVWDVDTEVTVQSLAVFQPALRVHLNSDGSRLGISLKPRPSANGDSYGIYGDPQVNVYDVVRGQMLKTVNTVAHDFDLSPDGKRLVIAESGGPSLFDVDSKQLIGRVSDYHFDWPTQILFSPDSKRIVLSTRQGTSMVDASTGQARFAATKLKERFYALAISPDGRQILGSLLDNTLSGGIFDVSELVLVDAVTGDEIKRYGAAAARAVSFPGNVTFKPDGSAVLFFGIIEGQWGLGQLNLVTGRFQRQIDETWDGSYAISNDSTRTASFTAGTYTSTLLGSVKVWDVISKTPLLTRTIPISDERYPYVQLGFSTDAKRLLVSYAKLGVQVWDTETGETVQILPAGEAVLLPAILSPDGKRVATTEINDIAIWDVATAKRIRTFTGHSNWVYPMVFSPDGKTLATYSSDGALRVWQVE
jgi:WD40 repeat protein/LysM repeat protein